MRPSTFQLPATIGPSSRRGFTLVELMVVIVIIGILSALITVAATTAIARAKEGAIKIELDNINQAFSQYKSDKGSLPPNLSYLTGALTPAQQNAFITHMRKAFPRHEEDQVIQALIAQRVTPAEMIGLFLGGFSPDPRFPLTGLGDRQPLFEFDETRFKPTGRVINVAGYNPLPLMAYYPKGDAGAQPYLYFDTSRDRATYGVPRYIGPDGSNVLPYLEIHPGETVPDMVNHDKFQILSAGLDGKWGPPIDAMQPIPYVPNGPFLGDHADNLANFSPRNMENSQP